MTIIIVSGLPPRWNMKILLRKLIKPIKGKYEVITIKCTKNSRTGYIRLSEKLNPKDVVNNINGTMFGSIKLRARIPDVEPKFSSCVKPIGLPMSLRRAYKIPNEGSVGEVLLAAHSEIMEELQSKYAGLYKLSKTTGHEILAAISRKVLGYLRWILVEGQDVETSFKLTKAYRSLHPHHGDFSLIQTTVHDIDKAAGRPLTTLSKPNLLTVTEKPYALSNMSWDKVEAICIKHSKRIAGELQNHIRQLNTDVNEQTDEELAVQKVRMELKKIVPYLPMMLQVVFKDNILQKKSMYYRVRIYGVPFLPNKEMVIKLLKKYLPVQVYRSDRMFNLMFCKVPRTTLPDLMEAGNISIGGATLYVRLSNFDHYKVPDAVVSEILSFKPARRTPTTTTSQANTDMDWNEIW